MVPYWNCCLVYLLKHLLGPTICSWPQAEVNPCSFLNTNNLYFSYFLPTVFTSVGPSLKTKNCQCWCQIVIGKNPLTWIRHKILKVGKTSVRESKVGILMQEKVGIPILKDFFRHYKMKKNITEPGWLKNLIANLFWIIINVVIVLIS